MITKLKSLSFLDLSAAFDTVDHSILQTRLSRSFGFTGTVIYWFESFVRSRSYRIKVNSSSDLVFSYCGVPQGSVLGLSVFSFYVPRLAPIVLCFHLHLHMFADGVLAYSSSPPLILKSWFNIGGINSVIHSHQE